MLHYHSVSLCVYIREHKRQSFSQMGKAPCVMHTSLVHCQKLTCWSHKTAVTKAANTQCQLPLIDEQWATSCVVAGTRSESLPEQKRPSMLPFSDSWHQVCGVIWTGKDTAAMTCNMSNWRPTCNNNYILGFRINCTFMVTQIGVQQSGWPMHMSWQQLSQWLPTRGLVSAYWTSLSGLLWV